MKNDTELIRKTIDHLDLKILLAIRGYIRKRRKLVKKLEELEK